MLAAATLLPVLIRAARPPRLRARRRSLAAPLVRAVAGRRPPAGLDAIPTHRRGAAFWERWTARVMRRPVVVGRGRARRCCSCSPSRRSRSKTGDGALRQFPAGNETRVGFEAAASVSRARARRSPVKVRRAASATPPTSRRAARGRSARIARGRAHRSRSQRRRQRAAARRAARHDGEADADARRSSTRLRDTLPAGAVRSAATRPARTDFAEHGQRLDVEDRAVRPRAELPRAAWCCCARSCCR